MLNISVSDYQMAVVICWLVCYPAVSESIHLNLHHHRFLSLLLSLPLLTPEVIYSH